MREPAYTSWKVAAADLKPMVPELAMLLPMTSRFAAATFRPLMPWEKLIWMILVAVQWMDGGGWRPYRNMRTSARPMLRPAASSSETPPAPCLTAATCEKDSAVAFTAAPPLLATTE